MVNKIPIPCVECRALVMPGEGTIWFEPKDTGGITPWGKPPGRWKGRHRSISTCMRKRGERAIRREARIGSIPLQPATCEGEVLLLRARMEGIVAHLGLTPLPPGSAQPNFEGRFLLRVVVKPDPGQPPVAEAWVREGAAGIAAGFFAPGLVPELWVSGPAMGPPPHGP